MRTQLHSLFAKSVFAVWPLARSLARPGALTDTKITTVINNDFWLPLFQNYNHRGQKYDFEKH